MNWKIIKETYPECFFKALISDVVKQRDLYDFFDNNGICLTARPIFYAGDTNPDFWSFSIDGCCKDHRFRAKTRKEAEEAMFNKGFEILEDKLTTIKTKTI